jgi:hypothetical protein
MNGRSLTEFSKPAGDRQREPSGAGRTEDVPEITLRLCKLVGNRLDALHPARRVTESTYLNLRLETRGQRFQLSGYMLRSIGIGSEPLQADQRCAMDTHLGEFGLGRRIYDRQNTLNPNRCTVCSQRCACISGRAAQAKTGRIGVEMGHS